MLSSHLLHRGVGILARQAAQPSKHQNLAKLSWYSTSSSTTVSSTLAESQGRDDRLFAHVDLELRAHQPQVLKSYAWYIEEAARQLDVSVVESEGEREPHKVRKTLLKSVFGVSKHRVQYEIQTYFWLLRAEKLTESTRDTFLEYIQRNLPEGVAMKVTCKEAMRLPKSIMKDIQTREERQN